MVVIDEPYQLYKRKTNRNQAITLLLWDQWLFYTCAGGCVFYICEKGRMVYSYKSSKGKRVLYKSIKLHCLPYQYHLLDDDTCIDHSAC